jgi:hypothetical protein
MEGVTVARRYNPNEIESLLDRIRYNLMKRTDKNGESYMELEESEEVLILKFRTKKSPEEKLAILDKLAGSGLDHGPEYIEEAIRLANREDEEDREDLDLG